MDNNILNASVDTSVFKTIMNFERQLNEIKDFDVLLERLLTEARALVNADAGSIYVFEDNSLIIKYAQNDTHQAKLENGQKLPFVHYKFPMNETSISGYCMKFNKIVNIEDVYSISPDMPFSFNSKVDLETNYRTKSMLCVPLVSPTGKKLGVLQIINAKEDDGSIGIFDEDKALVIEHFAISAATTLERAQLTRTMVMRMIEMARFRDPKETGPHVQRVASYSLEIYDRWAFEHNTDKDEAARFRDMLKIAATMHDVGKVGIPDQILKKNGKLTDEEYAVMKKHTSICAHLFSDVQSEIDELSRDVAVHHHERWDGRGYPGNIDYAKVDTNIIELDISGNPGLSGDAIPLAARIVSLADVFDALCSKRVYKDAWTLDKVLEEIRAQAGKQFDPDVVHCFFKVLPRLLEIKAAIPDVDDAKEKEF